MLCRGLLCFDERRILLGNKNLRVVKLIRGVVAQSKSVRILVFLFQHVFFLIELGEPLVLLNLPQRQSLLRISAQEGLPSVAVCQSDGPEAILVGLVL